MAGRRPAGTLAGRRSTYRTGRAAEIYPPTRKFGSPERPAGIVPVDVTTAPFPGFPTPRPALQRVHGAGTRATAGHSRITETIFEDRLMHVQAWFGSGPHPYRRAKTATVEGRSRLKGAP